MRVKCSICDKIETIDDDTLIAKRLRNRPIHTYMCQECHDRIAKNRGTAENGKIYFSPGTAEKRKSQKIKRPLNHTEHKKDSAFS